MNNVFALPPGLPVREEFVETLCSGSGVRIERIISHGQKTPEGAWLDQDVNEWVVLLQGEATLRLENGGELRMSGGDSVFLPAHARHRVERTSSTPPCVWLAVHGAIVSL